MAKKELSPEEKDQQATILAMGLTPPEDSSRGESVTWVWVLAGIIVLIALVGGAIGGWTFGRVFERSLPDLRGEVQWLMGAQFTDIRQGVLITSVVDKGPAGTVGLRSGDRIAALDGISVSDINDMADILSPYRAGDWLLVTVERDNRYLGYEMMLGVVFFVQVEPTPVAIDVTPGPVTAIQQEARLGITYRMLKPGDEFAVEEGAMIVRFLVDGSPAEVAGLLPGDIIIAVDGIAVSQGQTLSTVLGTIPSGSSVWVEVNRAGDSIQVQLVMS